MIDPDNLNASPLEGIAHIIQVALTPVFLLSGVAALLNVFSSRLARVADRLDSLVQRVDRGGAEDGTRVRAQLAYLKVRSHALDTAVILGSIAGGATCVAALALFVGAMRDSAGTLLLFVTFGPALVCTFGALAAFLIEVLMATPGFREEVRQSEARAEESAAEAAEPEHVDHANAAVVTDGDGS